MSTSKVISPNPTRGYVAALVSAAILSTTAILIRILTQTYQMPAIVLAFWRDSFVALTLWFILGILSPRLLHAGRQHLLYLVLYGLVLAIFNALWTLSVSLSGAALATVLVYSSVGFTALLGRCFLKESLHWTNLLAIGLSLGGCVMISGALTPGAWRSNLLGILAGTLSGLCYAIYSLMGRSASQRGLNPWTTILYTFGSAAAFLLLLNLLPGISLPGKATTPVDLFWLGSILPGWGILFLLAAGPTVLGFGLYNVSLGHLSTNVANLIVNLEPVFTAIIAFVLLGERMTGMQLSGSAMILTSVACLQWRNRRQTAENTQLPLSS